MVRLPIRWLWMVIVNDVLLWESAIIRKRKRHVWLEHNLHVTEWRGSGQTEHSTNGTTHQLYFRQTEKIVCWILIVFWTNDKRIDRDEISALADSRHWRRSIRINVRTKEYYQWCCRTFIFSLNSFSLSFRLFTVSE